MHKATNYLREFIRLGPHLSSSVLCRHLFFLLLSFIIIGITGYYFGTFDQSMHIPFLKKEVFPALYPNDPFFDLRKTHYSYFWLLFRPFLSMGVLEVSLFLTHLLSTYLTFWALWRLSKTLFKSDGVALLSVIAFSFPHIGFAGFPLFEFSLLNRTFVLPFLLFSIDLYLKKRYIASFLLLGIMNNIHALSVNFVLFMYGVDLLFRFFREKWKFKGKLPLGIGCIGFVLASLPVLIWKFGSSPLDFSLRPEWFSIISQSLMYTVFYPLSTSSSVLFLTICGVSTFLLYFVMTDYQVLSEGSLTITHFMYASIFLIGFEVIVSQWLPVTFVVQFQIIRIGIFSLIFAYLFFVSSLVSRVSGETITKRQFLMQFLAVFLSLTVLVPLVVSFLVRFLPKRDRFFAGYLAICTSLVVFGILAWQTNVWRPGIHIFPQKTDWYDVQMWAKNNTRESDTFLTPPDRWWFYEPDWRVFSERSTVTTISEVLEFAFTPEYTSYWKARFADVAPFALEKFSGDIFKSVRLTRNAYKNLSDYQFVSLAKKYGVSYIVVEKNRALPYAISYQNNSFTVYSVSPVLARFVIPRAWTVDKRINFPYHN